jgi:hypothetical protein
VIGYRHIEILLKVKFLVHDFLAFNHPRL